MKNQRITLNESQLNQIIKESILKVVLNEDWRDTGDEYALQAIQNNYDNNPQPESIQKEIKLINQFEKEFDQEFGPGSFKKARKIAIRFASLGLNPSNVFFKNFTSPATRAYDSWNRKR